MVRISLTNVRLMTAPMTREAMRRFTLNAR
jgi:hypothetical protein